MEPKRIVSGNDGVSTFLDWILALKKGKSCNEKLWVRAISLIDGFVWLLWPIFSKQARNYMSRKNE
jgi:hypothetical protein